MFKIGIIQSSSVGAAPTPPPSITVNPVSWNSIAHFLINDFFTYTTAQITGNQASYSLAFYYDPAYGLAQNVSIFKLCYKLTSTFPGFDNNYGPQNVLNNMTEYVPDFSVPTPITVPNNYYLSFGVSKGDDYDSYALPPVISTSVVVMLTANSTAINTFNITLNNERISIDPGDPGEEVIP